jgi:hypothetical protein
VTDATAATTVPAVPARDRTTWAELSFDLVLTSA